MKKPKTQRLRSAGQHRITHHGFPYYQVPKLTQSPKGVSIDVWPNTINTPTNMRFLNLSHRHSSIPTNSTFHRSSVASNPPSISNYNHPPESPSLHSIQSEYAAQLIMKPDFYIRRNRAHSMIARNTSLDDEQLPIINKLSTIRSTNESSNNEYLSSDFSIEEYEDPAYFSCPNDTISNPPRFTESVSNPVSPLDINSQRAYNKKYEYRYRYRKKNHMKNKNDSYMGKKSMSGDGKVRKKNMKKIRNEDSNKQHPSRKKFTLDKNTVGKNGKKKKKRKRPAIKKFATEKIVSGSVSDNESEIGSPRIKKQNVKNLPYKMKYKSVENGKIKTNSVFNLAKRHSIGHTNSGRLKDLKRRIVRHSDMSKIQQQTSVTWAKSSPRLCSVSPPPIKIIDVDLSVTGLNHMPSSFNSNEMSPLPLIQTNIENWKSNGFVKTKGNEFSEDKNRRRSLFNNRRMPTPLTNTSQYNLSYDEINSNKWNIKKLTSIVTESEFSAVLKNRSKEDIIELCWDLLRSKDKSDELLRMVSIMNQDLEKTAAFDTMLETVVQTLEVDFASLFVIEEESNYLKCIWTSNGEPLRDIVVSINSSTHIAARVYQKDQAIKKQLKQNNDSLCPDFDGLGYVYVMGIPIRNFDGDKIGVLMAYKDRSKNDMFDDSDLASAQMLTSIAATTIQNVKMYNDAQDKRKETTKILGIIDEMSGDASQGYSQAIRKIVRKIRSLVTCTEIDFWTVDLSRNILHCEISQNNKLQDMEIPRVDSNILGQVAITGRYVKIDNTRLDQRYAPSQLQYSPGESILVIPVGVESEIYPIAVIQAINKISKASHSYITSSSVLNNYSKQRILPFTIADLRLLQSFATSSAIVIKNSMLFQRIDGLKRKSEAMVGILRALQQKHDVAQMLNEATLSIRDALEAERVSIWFEDGQGNLDSLNFIDSEIEEDPEVFNMLYGAIARFCAEDKILINTPNIFEDENLWLNISDFLDVEQWQELKDISCKNCSVLCVPILSNFKVVGVIQAVYKISDLFFSIEDQQIVEAVSSEVAHTIARNISDLCLQKYVERHEDIPLDVIDYYLTGAYEPTYDNAVVYDDGSTGNNLSLSTDDHKTQEEPHKKSNSIFGAGTNNIHAITLDDRLLSYEPLLCSCDFDALQFENKGDLEKFTLYAMDDLDVISHFKLNVPKLQTFIHNVAKMYRSNPYHNWQHGFFVFHFVYYFIRVVPEMKRFFRKYDLLAILIASMCHDVDHPGNDNSYEIESETDLARIYNNESVLENHHTYTTLAMLRKTEMNFFEGSTINLKQMKEIKKIITKSILTTDMSHHSKTIDWLNDWSKVRIFEKLSKPNSMKEAAKKATILKMCQAIVHLGDLSSQTYPWRIAKKWELLIAEELKSQTVKETKLNLPVRDWMAKTDLPTRYKNQFFFMKHVVTPLWEPAVSVFPAMSKRLSVLLFNSKKYMDISTKLSERKKSLALLNNSTSSNNSGVQ